MRWHNARSFALCVFGIRVALLVAIQPCEFSQQMFGVEKPRIRQGFLGDRGPTPLGRFWDVYREVSTHIKATTINYAVAARIGGVGHILGKGRGFRGYHTILYDIYCLMLLNSTGCLVCVDEVIASPFYRTRLTL